MRLLPVTLWTVSVLAAAAVPAAEADKKAVAELAADPVVGKILDSLGAGASAELPAARTAGDLNEVARRYNLHKKGPGGRNYCVEMVWMADRKRAIYCGANHGSPHRLNDVWEYDLPSNTWVCLYGPDDLRKGDEAFTKAEFRNGALVTPRGGPVVMGHQWCQSTYDPATGTMYFNSQWPMGYFPQDIQDKYKSAENLHHPPLWSFRPAEGKWKPVFPAGKPVPSEGAAQNRYLQFVPALKGLFFADADDGMGSWVFNPETRLWKELLPGDDKSKKANSNPDLPFRLGMKAYCPDRKLLVICSSEQGGDGRTVQYDFAANKWTQTASGADIPCGHPSFTPCGYDPLGGAVLLYDQRRESCALWAYDVAGKKWAKVAPKGPAPPEGGKVIGYFDPERNAFVLDQGGKVWVYRHNTKAG